LRAVHREAGAAATAASAHANGVLPIYFYKKLSDMTISHHRQRTYVSRGEELDDPTGDRDEEPRPLAAGSLVTRTQRRAAALPDRLVRQQRLRVHPDNHPNNFNSQSSGKNQRQPTWLAPRKKKQKQLPDG
jgi:hypothetical protein